MRPIVQTKFGEGEGNCFAACLASLFPVELEDVPDFYKEHGTKWYNGFAEWVKRFGVQPIMYDAEYAIPVKGCYHLMGGPSPRGIIHSVVGFDGKMVHDPHPSGAGLEKVQDYTYFIITLNESS